MDKGPLDARISSMEHRVDEFRKQAKRMEDAVNNAQSGNQNVTRVMVLSEPDPHREWRTVLSAVCVLVAVFALYVAGRADAQSRANEEALRDAREAMARKYDRMEDYQRTMFMLVPDLKKMVDAEMAKREGEKR